MSDAKGGKTGGKSHTGGKTGGKAKDTKSSSQSRSAKAGLQVCVASEIPRIATNMVLF